MITKLSPVDQRSVSSLHQQANLDIKMNISRAITHKRCHNYNELVEIRFELTNL
jgi:hypothetical protein